MALISFADELTEEIFDGIHTHAIRKSIPMNILLLAERKLDILNAVDSEELLKKLGMERDGHGRYSIPLDLSWRLCFKWTNNNIQDVELKQ